MPRTPSRNHLLSIQRLPEGGIVVSRHAEGCLPELLFAATDIDDAFQFISETLE